MVASCLHLTHSCDSPGKLKEPGLQKNLELPLFLAVGAASDMMLHSGIRARSHSKSLLRVWHHRIEGSAAAPWVAVVKYSSAFGLSSSLFTDLFTSTFPPCDKVLWAQVCCAEMKSLS